MSLNRFTALPRRSRNVLQSLLRQHAANSHRPSAMAQLRAWPNAIGTIWQERSGIAEFLRSGDEELAYDLRRKFGLGAPLGDAFPIPSTLFDAGPLASQETATIIIPIYKAEASVARLLRHLLHTLPRDQNVICVDDGSNCPSIDALLNQFQKTHPETQIIRSIRNQGFVLAVNSAFAKLEPGHHAILLNSDTLPPENWIQRLLAPFALDPDIASVSPVSNTAEVLSIPRSGTVSDLSSSLVTQVDAVAGRLKWREVALPTGVGFCLALNHRFLNRVGPFDAAFGKGYGEEVDWCLRASAVGGRHVVATNLFVGHEGSASFGAEERGRRVAKASRMIAGRFPAYAQSALDWEKRDPIAPERLALSIAWLAAVSDRPVPIFMAHSLGGGAETALQQEVSAFLASGQPAVVILRVGGPAAWRVELQGARFAMAGDVKDEAMVHRMMDPLERRKVIYSCAVRSANPGLVPDMLLALAEGQELLVRLHDFFPISPSWNLIGSDGSYAGIPALNTRDPAHAVSKSRQREGISHLEWRIRWGRVMETAQEVTAFAETGRTLIEEAFEEARGKVVIRPHELRALPTPVPIGGQSIGVLGGINLAKGGAILEALGARSRRRIIVVGELDGQFKLPAPHHVHGPYDRSQITALARLYDIGVWFLPSICPETFSFATHEALATKLPVASFDLGAQAEALRDAPNGHVLSASPGETSVTAAALDRLFD